MNKLRTRATELVRSLTWHRRLLAAGIAAAGTAIAIEAAAPGPPETVDVLVAGHAIDGGTPLDDEQLTTASVLPGTVPDGALSHDEAVGRTLAGPIRAGEIITDARVVSAELLDGWSPGSVATPIRLADADAAAMLRPGDKIDVLAAGADGSGTSEVVAHGVPVLTVTTDDDDDAISDGGELVVVAATPEQAKALAAAAASSHLSYTLRAAHP